MNKIWTLYNMEFKRIYKLYFVLLGALGIGNLLGTGFSLYNTAKSLDPQRNGSAINILRSNITSVHNFTTRDIYIYGCLTLGVSVLICLIYALGIWYRDYFSRNKTIYTLLSLPQPKFNIYLAKFFIIVAMIYGVIASQFLMWFIDLSIVKIIVGINSPSFVNIFTTILGKSEPMGIVSLYVMDFIMINVLGVISAVLVIFTAVLIERAFNKIGPVMGIVYISICIFGYIGVVFIGVVVPGGSLLSRHLLYYLVMNVISIALSYNLINKRLHV